MLLSCPSCDFYFSTLGLLVYLGTDQILSREGFVIRLAYFPALHPVPYPLEFRTEVSLDSMPELHNPIILQKFIIGVS